MPPVLASELPFARPESEQLGRAVAWLRWVVIATILLITLTWPMSSRTGHRIWLWVLGFAAYNLLISLLRHRVPRLRSFAWVAILDLPAAGLMYYFDFEPGGPLFVLFFLAVVTAGASMTLRATLAYTAVVVTLVSVIAPTLPLWDSSSETLRQFASRVAVLAVVGIGTAYLTRRLAEEQDAAQSLRGEAARLEDLGRIRADVIASISHDVRTPLTAIRAGLGMIEDRVGDRLPGDERRLLAGPRRSAERLAMLIDDLLAHNQLQAGALHLDLEPLDLCAVAVDAVPVVHPLIQERGQTLELDLPDPLPLRGDPARLGQVVVNLLANAHFHTPGGTRIVVAGRADDGEVRLTVRDNGPGIPPAELDAIFRRFYRPTSANRRPAAGSSGLGLAITRSLVELHGGRVWAESRPGAGAAFHVVLPA